jgi:hypothetical protein
MPKPTSGIGIAAPIAAAMLLVAAVVIVVLVPLYDCKQCQILIAYEEAIRLDKESIVIRGEEKVVSAPSMISRPPRLPGCPECVRGKQTLLQKWLGSRR